MIDGTTVLALVALALGVALVVSRRRAVRFRERLASQVRALRRRSQSADAVNELPVEWRRIWDDFEDILSEWQKRLDDAGSEREWLLSVLARMPDGVVVTDARGIVVLANRALLQRARMAESRAIGRLFIEVVQDHEANEVLRRCLATGKEQKALIEFEPGRSYLNVAATPLGQGRGCVVVMQDVTELRRLEKVRRDFVSNVSHELRTPLASLRLLAETVASGAADEPAVLKDYLQRIEVEVDRLAQMVDELGELSLIETGQVSLEKRPIDVGLVVTRAAERLEAQAFRAGVQLDVNVGQDLPQAEADERRLEQVLVNLLHNAIKFTPSGGRVEVAAQADAERLTVTVSDTGVGIAEDDLPRIFERFYKADKSRASRGTGLGLAIARHIVEAHDGRIWAESREGSGSVFGFSLPRGPRES